MNPSMTPCHFHRDSRGDRSVLLRERYRFSQAAKAFSLVEVALALGLMGFALTAIMGLLSVGMSSSRGSLERSVEAQILDWAHSQARRSYEEKAFDSLGSGPLQYFDADGIPLEAASQGERIYSATMTPGKKSLPGSSQEIWGVEVVIRVAARGNQPIGSHAFWFSN